MPVSIHTLRRSGREPPLPMKIVTSSGDLIIFDWLRVLPRQRLVGAGELLGRPVLVKLFIAPRAMRHWQREVDGLILLEQAHILTPKVVASGELDGGGYFLCTDYLAGAETLQQYWKALPADKSQSRLVAWDPEAIVLLKRALRSIALLHRAGLTQLDLHMGNFLVYGDELYVIDGDAIKASSPGYAVSGREAEDNLSIFFAQLDSHWDAKIELLLIEYLQVNTERALNPDRLQAQVKRIRANRLRDWLTKAVRDCSHFMVHKTWWQFSSVVREHAADLGPLLAAPDQPFSAAPMLKDGGSSSVTQVEAGGRALVIKRYNIKGLGHWLSRFWRPSRAWHSWLAGHQLHFLGIATPAPLAMIESRFGWMRRRAWLVTEFCSGPNLLDLLGPDGKSVPTSEQSDALLGLLAQLRQARITHGDFKATNLLWHAEHVWLIDLDSMQFHKAEAGYHRAWMKDRARFVRNWPQGSALTVWLETHLPQ
jgi:tRNA A-37 threonylcarbamoyl transferase component Bud32